MPVHGPPLTSIVGLAVKIRNDHHRKLEPLRLMNGHHPNRVCRIIDLPLAFAASGFFKITNKANEVADQMCTGAFESFCQSEQLLDIGQTLRTVEVCSGNRSVLRRINRESQKI